MDISFRTLELKMVGNDRHKRDVSCGSNRSKRLALRLDQLRAARTLAEFMTVHTRCRLERGQSSNIWSAAIDDCCRIFFEATGESIPKIGEVSLDAEMVTSVRILSIETTNTTGAK